MVLFFHQSPGLSVSLLGCLLVHFNNVSTIDDEKWPVIPAAMSVMPRAQPGSR